MHSPKKLPTTLLPKAPGLKLRDAAIDTETVSFSVESTRPVAACPACGQRTARLHSHYLRTLADLPWGGRSVRLSLRVRRFRCTGPECPRRIFAERLPSVVEPYARKAARLREVLGLVGFALGGEGGTRLLRRLGMTASPSTLVRYVRGSPEPVHPEPRVVGIDDWAFRRGHLIHNLADALEEFLLQKKKVLREAARTEKESPEEDQATSFSAGSLTPNRPRIWYEKQLEASRKRHERIVEQWRNIRRLCTLRGRTSTT